MFRGRPPSIFFMGLLEDLFFSFFPSVADPLKEMHRDRHKLLSRLVCFLLWNFQFTFAAWVNITLEKIHIKSGNLQYNMLGCWVDRLIDQVSDGPSIILLIKNKAVGCWLEIRQSKINSRWVAGPIGQRNRRPSVWCSKNYFFRLFYRLRALKTLYFYFCIF